MTLIRFNNGMQHMDNRYNWGSFDRLMEALIREKQSDDSVDFVPPVNIIEKERTFVIELAVPGLKKEDLSISIENGILTIVHEGEKAEYDEARFIRQEIVNGRFNRKFRLSRWVDQEKVEARMENGILVLEIAKKEEAIAKPSRQIEIA